jgi:hypothetical protein
MTEPCRAPGCLRATLAGQPTCEVHQSKSKTAVPVPDPNWFGEFWAINHRWPTDDEILEQSKVAETIQAAKEKEANMLDEAKAVLVYETGDVDDYVSFGASEAPERTKVQLVGAMWQDMGSPKQVTVTVRPGDHMNDSKLKAADQAAQMLEERLNG